jgi:hypothetical protein
MGIARKNPEDLLVADRLLNNEKIAKVVDLREEIKVISDMTVTNLKKDEDHADENNYENEWDSRFKMNCLEMLNKCYGSVEGEDANKSNSLEFEHPFCTDGTFFYWIPNNSKT